MYMAKPKPQAAHKKEQPEQSIPVGNKKKSAAGSGLSYEDVQIRYNIQGPLQMQEMTGNQGDHDTGQEQAERAGEHGDVIQRSPIPMDTIMALFREGMKISAIAATVGLSSYLVYKLIRRCLFHEENQDGDVQAAEEEAALPETPQAPEEKDIGEAVREISQEEPRQEKRPQELFREEVQPQGVTQEQLYQQFMELASRLRRIYSPEEFSAKNPPDAIKIWRRLRHKGRNLTADEVAELEIATPSEKNKIRGPVPEEQPEPQQIEETEEDPREARARDCLGPLDTEHSYSYTPCGNGSMLVQYLRGKQIIDESEKISIGHQAGWSRQPKRFVVIIRGQQYLIFQAQHPGEDYKEYKVMECHIKNGREYGLDLEGKRIHIGGRGFELKDGSGLI